MVLTINEELYWLLLDESGRRFTRCEAFEYLYSMITESDDGAFHTSYNRLAKAWNWDNHLVKDFICKLIDIKVLAMQHERTSLVLYFTGEFGDHLEALSPLFSLLSLKGKKASKAEALLAIVRKIGEQKDGEPLITSSRSLATELGWSHHTVLSFLDLLAHNGIISRSPSTDGNTFELRWANNIQ